MKIAITGSTGFIGTALIRSLSQDKNHTLFPFDKNKHSLSSVETLKDFVADKDLIIHLAGITKSVAKSNNDFYEVNTLGTANLLEAISLHGKPKTHFLFASTFAVYEETETKSLLTENKTRTLPRNHYGMSKLLAEELINFYHRKTGMPIRILRIANLYGPGEINGVIARMIKKIQEEKEPIVLTEKGRQTRDFIYIQDVITAIIKTLEYHDDYLLVNICSGKELQLTDVLKKIERLMDKKAHVQYNRSHSGKGYWIGNPQKAIDLLNFRNITDIDSGLSKTIQAYT